MWWREHRRSWGLAARLVLVFAAAGLTAGCFEPLYGGHGPAVAGSETVHDKLAAIDVPVIAAPKGQPLSRVAVGMRNALQFDLNGGSGPNAPTHTLIVYLGITTTSIIVDVTSGRPDAQLEGVSASYRLVEIATGKSVLSDTTYAHVDYDVPGSAQRFAAQRAERDAQDRAIQVIADTIRNRLASYFVAGT
jgi:LPS-assembly lipoprotein